MGPCLPALGNQTLGPEGADSRSPLYPPRGTRRSGRGGLLSLTPLPASGNQTLGQRGPTLAHPSTRLGEPDARAEGATLLHPSTRLREPDARAQGATLLHPLYPPQGTRRSGTGGLLSLTPLPASGNQTLGQRGPTHLHPSTRLGEPDARAEGAYSPAPLYPPRGTRRSGRGGLLSLTPLPASGNQTLGQRGPTHLHPSTRLDLSHLRPPFLRGPPGPPGGTPTRPPGEPGHPTLKPGSLTLPNGALRRTGPLVTPGEIYHWSPLIDLGFVRLVSDFQGEPGVSLCPPSALPSRGTPLRSRPRCFPRHWSPLIDLGFVRLVSDFQGEPGVSLCPPSALPSPLRIFPRPAGRRVST